MSISHIPRGVGHNFVPEYQISSVLYSTSVLDRTSNLSFVLVQKQRTINGQANQDSFREVGFASAEASNGDITLTITDADTTPEIVFGVDNNGDANPAKVSNLTANFVLVRKLSLPKISSWIQLENTVNSDKIIYFSKKDVINHSNFIKLASEEKTVPLKLRVTDLYFRNSTLDAAATTPDQNKADGENIKIIAGLTSINSNEFKDTIETFLGDNK